MLNKIVLKFKDGTVMKGITSDFFPNKRGFHLELADGETLELDVEQLKAVFFVKSFEGKKDYDESYRDIVPGGGLKMRVKFEDGEELVGYSQGYEPERRGFFIIPADSLSNNERIFVIRSATSQIDILQG